MTARIDEIALDLYRICLYVPAFDLQFNHFLVKDEEPLLFHTGPRAMFAEVQPKTLATMHGSVYVGDGARALRDLATVFKDILGPI